MSQLNRGINAELADLKLPSRFSELNGVIIAGGPSNFARLLIAETEKWAKVVKFAGMKLD